MAEILVKNSYRRLRSHFISDSLFRNSIYLMISTGIQAVLGFAFWIVAARLYTAPEVGIATTLVSTISLISAISLFGFNTALIRYLPESKDRQGYVGTIATAAIITSSTIAVGYIILLHQIAPKLASRPDQPMLWVLLLIGSISISLTMLSDNLFISLRQAKFVTFTSATFSITKLLLLFAAVNLGAYGPFGAQISGYILALAISLYIQRKYFGIRYRPQLDFGILRRVRRFSFGSYLASLANSLPGLLLPIVILNQLGPSSVAYFYVSLMIANVLFIIPQATTQSQFAEGSNDPDKISSHSRIASIQIACMLIPALILVLILAPYIMLVFGPAYQAGGVTILRLLCLSSIFISINSILTTVLRIRNMVRSLAVIGAVTTMATFLFAYALIDHGLIGVGIGWNIGEALTSVLLVITVMRYKKPYSALNSGTISA